jgi:hypothetical protein
LCKDYIEDYSKELEVLDPNFNYCRTLLLTFLHEFGHLAFSYLDCTTLYEGEGKTTHESRANFLPSYVHDGKIDMYIEQFVANQPKSYQAPLLYKEDKWRNDSAIKQIYFQP